MKIIRDEQSATWTLVPVETDEELVIKSVIEKLRPGDKLFYDGKKQDGDENLCIVYLYAGGHKEKRVKTMGIEQVDGVKLTLVGTTEEDKREVRRIRDTCYFGSGGLIFLGKTEVDGKKAIVTTGLLCKRCGAGMINCHNCECGVCDVCAADCKHR